MPRVNVVIVSYNSRAHLRACVEPLLSHDAIEVTVVDNASDDGSAESLRGLPLRLIERDSNAGFAAGCNAGWRSSTTENVLFLNPDAQIETESVIRLAEASARHPRAGAVAPRILHPDGRLDFSLRRFPRLRSTFARALFVHRLLPHVPWTDEVGRGPVGY